jgi:hypothetical protein
LYRYHREPILGTGLRRCLRTVSDSSADTRVCGHELGKEGESRIGNSVCRIILQSYVVRTLSESGGKQGGSEAPV